MAQRKMLLIVDDDPDVREGLAEQLGLQRGVRRRPGGRRRGGRGPGRWR